MALFLSTGNIQNAFGSKFSDDVHGAMRRLPITGPLFLSGFFAITGSPPFGPFLSEFTIITAALNAGQFTASILFLLFLGIVFIGMGATILPAVQGEPSQKAAQSDYRDGFFVTVPILASMAVVLLLGFYLPPPLESLLREAAAYLEVKP